MAEITAPSESIEGGGIENPFTRASYRIGMLVGALLGLGLVMVTSAEAGVTGSNTLRVVLLRRIGWLAAGGFAFGAGAIINHEVWKRHSLLLLAVAVGLLLAVFVPSLGASAHGARRWIRVGNMGLQPSEFAKFALLIWLAAHCARQRHRGGMSRFTTGFFAPMIAVAVVCALVLVEPDFGTSVLIGCVSMAVLLVAGTRIIWVVLLGIGSVPLMHALVFNVPYRMRRVTAFLDPWAAPRGAGYQLVQSLIALGSGGLTGEGLGTGGMGFLPAARNDFIFSALGQQLGFIGSAVVILAFLWLVWEGVGVARSARTPFGCLAGTGIALLLGLQAAVHIAVVSGSVPTKGLSLPFLSAGGSSLFFSLWAAGILVNIARSVENPQEVNLRGDDSRMPGYERAFYAVIERARDGLERRFRGNGNN
ncbi:MAG: FtsW/RodA/SpoVE family cell cycle protein [Candidatus Brocadiia bacterium]